MPLSPKIHPLHRYKAHKDWRKSTFATAREQGLEGVIGKQKDSLYQPGKRSGAWIKYRVNRGQELVIGGYVPGTHGLDSIVVGYYKGEDLRYVARVRNGFVPASRRQVFGKLQPRKHVRRPRLMRPVHRTVTVWGGRLDRLLGR